MGTTDRSVGDNPFTPGSGVTPPLLAGREQETDYFKSLFDGLSKRKFIDRDVIVYGPRGNGKTSFLNSMLNENERRFSWVDDYDTVNVVMVSADELQTPLNVAKFVTGERIPDSETIHQRTSGGLDTVLKLDREEGETGTYGNLNINIGETIKEATRDGSLLFIIDEAHTLDANLGREILNGFQNAREVGSPTCLVLSGTPNLPKRIRQMKATFVERSKELRMGRLDSGSTEEALISPLEENGMEIDIPRKTFKSILETTSDYPYFIQCMGHNLWEEARKSRTNRIGKKESSRSLKAFKNDSDSMYAGRYEELRDEGLLDYASVIPRVFETTKKGCVERSAIEEAISTFATDEKVLLAVDELTNLGVLWCPSPSHPNTLEPGIPSLLDYISKHTPVSAGEGNRRKKNKIRS